MEVLALLHEAFLILGADDIRKQFGADDAWETIEEIHTRHFNQAISTSPRQRMAVAGQKILEWLAQPFILKAGGPSSRPTW